MIGVTDHVLTTFNPPGGPLAWGFCGGAPVPFRIMVMVMVRDTLTLTLTTQSSQATWQDKLYINSIRVTLINCFACYVQKLL